MMAAAKHARFLMSVTLDKTEIVTISRMLVEANKFEQ